MIDKQKIQLCAQNIVKCVNLKKKGASVLIKGGFYSQELLEEIALEVFRNNGRPIITSTTDYYTESIYDDKDISIDIIATTPHHYFKLMENIDAYIVIEPYENPGILNKVPREKLKANGKSLAPIRDVLYGGKKEYEPGKKWCYAAWPSEKAASFYGIDYELFEKFVIGGISIPLEEMTQITKELGDKFNNVRKVHVTDDLGTDFWISVEGRPKILDNGLITDERIAVGELGANLPAGEIFFPPNETMGEGKLICPLTKDRYSNKIIKNIELNFENGKLDMDKISSDNDVEVIIESFKQCEEIDRKNEVPELRTYNVAELGIGCNPEITKAIGYILTDEKITGSIHLAFGGNAMMQGNSRSQMHWDFVSTPKANVIVELMDGSKKSVMENGRLI